jgi:subtilisin family serine protease
MSSREIHDLFDQFGITRYHANNIFGQGVSILIIDTGLERTNNQNVHGLAVASLILGDDGVEGIAPKASVDVVDVHDPSSIPIQVVIDAIRKGIDQDVDIICISLGTDDPWGPLQEVVSRAASKGILVFAAAGNSGERGYEFPAACHDAISVGSMNASRQPSPFNTKNDAVVVFAPGEKLRLPTGAHGSLQEFTGTSFATPFAAGLATLVLSAKRLESKTRHLRMKRKDMVDTLRGVEHFALNCTDHTYVMEKTCTDFPEARSHAPSQHAFRNVHVGLGVLALLLVWAVVSLLNK